MVDHFAKMSVSKVNYYVLDEQTIPTSSARNSEFSAM